MDNKNPVLYLGAIFLGLAISVLVIKGNFSPQILGFLVFCFLFIPTLIKPDIGLIVIIVSMLLSPEFIVGSTTVRLVAIRAEDVILAVIILAWFLRVSLTKSLADTFKTPLTVPFFFYMLSCIVSTLLAAIYGEIDLALSFFTMLKYFEYFMLFIMTRDIIKNMRQIKIFVLVFFLTAFIVSIYSNTYINESMKSGAQIIRVSPPNETRRGGEAGTLGGYLIFAMAITAGLLLNVQTTPVRILLICLELAMFRAFLYTLSRGSYLAVIPVTATLIYFTKRNKAVLIYSACVIAVMLIFFAPKMVKERVMTTVTTEDVISGKRVVWEESPRERLNSWKEVLFERFPKRPIFGYGVARYFIDGQIFLTLCEVGLLGFILFGLVLARLFKMAKEVLDIEDVKNDGFGSGLTVGFLAGFIGVLFSAIGTNTFLIIKIMEPFWFMAAIVLSQHNVKR
ncbi:MAG: O-antigen ligase family protein [Candidatus Omnitrophica bacterium]|nr:O-antigen ligase family protein [Candidatus Omnitrophota bacterium]